MVREDAGSREPGKRINLNTGKKGRTLYGFKILKTNRNTDYY